jgi:KEOPS complex subunit Pcc1
MPKATLHVVTPHSKALMGALSPEAGREIPRTLVHLTHASEGITLTVDAVDASALRAALNSYLRWIGISEDIGKMVGESNG